MSTWQPDVNPSSSLLTIFAVAKAFRGLDDVRQRNAVASWARVADAVILFGDDPGVADAAHDLGVRHRPGVECNGYGTPLLHHVFATAQAETSTSLVCYLNADIVVTADLRTGAAAVAQQRRQFLLVARRRNLDVTEPLPFQREDVDRWLLDVADHGQLDGKAAIDVFLFPRGLYEAIPPFAVGRPAWDNWMIRHARERGITIVDATYDVPLIHQDPGLGVTGERSVRWTGPEAQRNRELAGRIVFTIDDATHQLVAGRLRPLRSWEHARHRANQVVWSTPWLATLRRRLRSLAHRTGGKSAQARSD